MAERARYRIRFPLVERLRFCLDESEYAVMDCSEGGLRFVVREGYSPLAGAEIEGQVTFRGGAVLTVCGTVVRVTDSHVSVRFTSHAVPFCVILDEQRRLRHRSPLSVTGPSNAGPEPSRSDNGN